MRFEECIYDFFFNKKSCVCENIEDCNKIKNKYSIYRKDEQLNMSTARDFVYDVWNIRWNYPDTLLKNLKRFNLLLITKNTIASNKYRVTYENLFKFMNMRLYQFYQITRVKKGV